MPLIREKLEEAITATKDEIERIKTQHRAATDPSEKKRLEKRRKELQYLQLWHIAQYENLGEELGS